VISAASSLHIPATYGLREFVQSGGLMSYGPDLADLYRRTAAYIDKIIKGAQPGELPLQLAEKYELVINKTAKALAFIQLGSIRPSLSSQGGQDRRYARRATEYGSNSSSMSRKSGPRKGPHAYTASFQSQGGNLQPLP
jgi:ABC transporter substrate binding protein